MTALVAEWLSFTPAYTNRRGSQQQRLGAHAFNAGARSLCGYAQREKAGGPADDTARRCVWCERVVSGMCPDRSSP